MGAGETVIQRRALVMAAVPTFLLLTIGILLLATHCSQKSLRNQVQQLERAKKAAEVRSARFQAESQAKDRYLATITSLLNDVGSRIDQIQQEQQGLVSLTVQGGGDALRIVKNKSIPDALERIGEELKINREQITQLETLAAAKSAENQGLRAVVERLKKQNEDLESQLQNLLRKLGGLSKQVKKLESQVGKLETEVIIKDKAIEEREAILTEQGRRLEVSEAERATSEAERVASEAERWAGYIVEGTREELRGKAILVSGLLQSMKKPRLSERFADLLQEFEKVDVRNIREIPLGVAKEVQLLPARPVGSYAVEKRDGQSYLLIHDPAEFWRVHRHLVVVTNK